MIITGWWDFLDAINARMESLREDIEAANDNEDFERERQLHTQLEAVEKVYYNL